MGMNMEQIKKTYHNGFLELCKVFSPAILSLNEIYNPVTSLLNQGINPISLTEEINQNTVPSEAVQVLHALKSDAQRERTHGIVAESEAIEFGMHYHKPIQI